MYSEIYKPITEGIESQNEKLSRQLKTLPGIEGQLALLPRRFVDKILEAEEQQKLAELLEEPPPEELQKPLTALPQKLDDEEIDKYWKIMTEKDNLI